MKKILSGLLALALLFSLCGFSAFASEGATDSDTPIAMPAEAGTPENTQNAMDTMEDTDEGTTEEDTEDTPQPPDLTGGVVTGFLFEKIFAGLPLESYEKGKLEDLYFLIDTITAALDCTVLLPDGQETSALCTAEWDTDTLPLDVGGIYEVTATLTPPAGCVFGDGVRQKIIMPVQISDPDGTKVFITEIDEWIPNSIAIAVPVGEPIEAVANHVDLEDMWIEGKDENGAAQNSTVEWDFSTVDMSTPGLYRVAGALKPPPGLAFSPELTLPEPMFTVSVQTPGSPDINCYSRGRSVLVFPWLLTEAQKEQLDLFEVWMAVDGVWSKLKSGYGLFSHSLQILLPRLSVDHSYELQVDYPGGQTGILSFTYDGTKLDSDYSGGDRDGSDGGGIAPPSVVQPPNSDGGDHSGNGGGNDNSDGDTGGDTLPSTPIQTPKPIPTRTPEPTPKTAPSQSPEPAPPAEGGTHTAGTPASAQNREKQPQTIPPVAQALAPSPAITEEPVFLEESNATSIIISGLRLRMMQEESLQFAKQGVSVTLSTEASATLNLADDDVFSMEILRESDTTFSFAVLVNEKPVTALAGTTVSLPYTPKIEAPVLTLRHEKAETVTTGSYEPQQRLATFVVDTTGGYTILEEELPAAAGSEDAGQTKPDATPILPIALAALCLLALGGGLWVRRGRSVK